MRKRQGKTKPQTADQEAPDIAAVPTGGGVGIGSAEHPDAFATDKPKQTPAPPAPESAPETPRRSGMPPEVRQLMIDHYDIITEFLADPRYKARIVRL